MAAGAASASAPGGAHLLSFELVMPPSTQLVLALDFAKHVRHVDLTPADASRGLDVGPAAVRVRVRVQTGGSAAEGGSAAASYTYTLYSEAAVVPVPIADGSMPFNVMAITSTLVSLFVGSMFNSLVARGTAM